MMSDMPIFVDWFITILVVVLVSAYGWYLVSLRRQPTRRRPQAPLYDRFGKRIGMVENPDYHVLPTDEPDESDEPGEE